MNLERQLSAMLRLGNYPKNNLKMSFFCESLFWFLLKNAFLVSFQKQPVVVAHGVCGCLPDFDSYPAAAAHVTNERHSEGDGELLLT